MTHTLRYPALISLVMALVFFAFAGTASAAGVGGALQDAADFLGLNSAGELISSEIYGNTSNPSGNGEGVLPSWAPGPWVCDTPGDGCDGPTNPGGSMGDIIAPLTSDGAGTPEFADGTDPDIDFSEAHL